jgi:type II secretory pathway pseudopilin PulG
VPAERRPPSEAGISVIEVVVASALLLAALAIALSGLDSQTRQSVYAQQRSEALDDLRLMSTVFAKDVRASAGATAASPSDITIKTYSGGALTNVRWRAFGDRLERTIGGVTSTYVVDLVSTAVFVSVPSGGDPANIRRVSLVLSTRPDPRYPAVTVETEVEMRNV